MTNDTEWRLAAGIPEALTEQEHDVVRNRLGLAATCAPPEEGEPATRLEALCDDARPLVRAMRVVARIVGRETPEGPATPACRLTRKAGDPDCDVLVLKRHAGARFRVPTAAPAAADAEVSLPISAVRRLRGAKRGAAVRVVGEGRDVSVAVGGAEHACDAPWAAMPAANCRRIVDDDEPLLPTVAQVDAGRLREALGNLPKGDFGQTCRIGLGPDGVRAWTGGEKQPLGEPVVLSPARADGPEAARLYDRSLLEEALGAIDGPATLRTGAGPSDTLSIASADGSVRVVLSPRRD